MNRQFSVVVGACLSLGALLACAPSDDTPVLGFDTVSSCGDGAACIDTGVEAYQVDGIRVLHKRLPGHPLFAVRVSFDAQYGAKQLWSEELALGLFERSGAYNFTSSTWDAALLQLSATLGSFAGTDYASIYVLAPVPNWNRVWRLLIEGLSRPGVSDYELDYRRRDFERAFTAERDDPGTAAGVDAWSRLFQGDVYNLRRETPDTLAAVSSEDVFTAWSALLTRERMLVVVVGDVEQAQVESALRAASPALYPAGVAAFSPEPPRQALPQPDIALLPYPAAPTWYIVGNFKGPTADSPDYAALGLGLAVLDQRLFQEVRDARGLAYSTGARLSFYRRSFGTFWLTTKSPREALPVARQIMADLKSEGPRANELAAARAGIRTSLLSGSDGPAGLASTLGDWQLTAGRHEALDEYLAALDQAQPEAVAAALDTYLRNVKTAAAGGGSELTEADLSTLFVSP